MAIEEVKFSLQDCITCGIVFQITTSLEARRRKDGKNLYCPNGHAMAWEIGKTVEQKLADALAEAARLRVCNDHTAATLRRCRNKLKKQGVA